MGYEEFQERIASAVSAFRRFDKEKTIRLVGHIDADGISAAAILVKALNRENIQYSLSVVQQLNKDVLRELSGEEYDYYIFFDIGSGQLDSIKEMLPDKEIMVLDHHPVQNSARAHKKLINVNPHLFGVDGSQEISGSGVVYLFARTLNQDNKDLAYLAVIGAIGDIQENRGMHGLNKRILEDAAGKIEVRQGLRFFGYQTKPMHKVLEYSTDPYIPGVSGSESGAIQFLQQIGVSPRGDRGWRKMSDLDEDELKQLVAGIVMKRVEEASPEDIIGPVYLITDEEDGSPMRDVREFATLLNACGRLDKASLGIGACLGDPKMKSMAIKTLHRYKREIINALDWYSSNKERVIRDKGFIIINAEEDVMSTMIGTLASIISKSNEAEPGTFILSMARNLDHTTKVSLRLAGNGSYEESSDIDLREKMLKIIKGIAGAEAGGHAFACGALIPSASEAVFIENAKRVLGAIEEKII